MTDIAQTLSTMLEELPPREQENVLDRIRPIIADAIDEIKWNNSYKNSSNKLEDVAKSVREMKKTPLDTSRL